MLHSAAARSRILWQDHRPASELGRMNERQNDGGEEVGGGQGENLKVLCYGRANITSNRSDLFPLNVICYLCLLRALLEFPEGNEGATFYGSSCHYPVLEWEMSRVRANV